MDAGILTQAGKVAVVEDAFEDTPTNSRATSRLASRNQSRSATPAGSSPASSAPASAANSGDEAVATADGIPAPVIKKKKLTKKQLKDQEVRRRLRTVSHLFDYGIFIGRR